MLFGLLKTHEQIFVLWLFFFPIAACEYCSSPHTLSSDRLQQNDWICFLSHVSYFRPASLKSHLLTLIELRYFLTSLGEHKETRARVIRNPAGAWRRWQLKRVSGPNAPARTKVVYAVPTVSQAPRMQWSTKEACACTTFLVFSAQVKYLLEEQFQWSGRVKPHCAGLRSEYRRLGSRDSE